MEESEKRRERLRAMRIEADQVDITENDRSSALPSYLSNPLIGNSATTPSHEIDCSTPRFDFYTDPMAAFASNKRKSNTSNQVGSNAYMPPYYNGYPTSHCPGTSNPELTPPPGQFQRDHLQGQSYSRGPTPYGSPVRITRPFAMNQATPTVGPYYQSRFPSPGSGWNGGAIHGWAPRPGHSPSPRPCFNPSPGSGRGQGNWRSTHPSPTSGPYGSQTFPGSPRLSHSPSPRAEYPGSPNTGPRPGRGNGRWVGFFDESMLEDPWKFLEPVLWKNMNSSSKSWMPRSLAPKKSRASQSWSDSGTQPSLAEYLAASFNEAVDDVPSK